MDEFKDLRILAVDYDDRRPDVYEPGTFLGLVIKTSEHRFKVLYVYKEGGEDIAWLERRQGRPTWTDKTFSAIVSVQEAVESQRLDFFRRISPQCCRERIAQENPSHENQTPSP